MDNISHKELLVAAISAAQKAGKAILEVYHSDFAIEQKDDKSPLTLADKRSHEIIATELKSVAAKLKCDKSFMLLSEEGREIPYTERGQWENFWLVDPLDGTKEFIKRNGEFTVNIALIHKNKPVIGCIYIPEKDNFYFAAKDIGAYKLQNGKSITNALSLEELVKKSQKLPLQTNYHRQFINNDINSPGSKEDSLTVIGSRSHGSEKFEGFIKQLEGQYKEIKLISAGSSLKFCLIAEGLADIYPRLGPTMEWDTAAGQAIVEEANGEVIDIQTKKSLIYNKENLVNPFFLVTGQGISASQFN